MKRFKGSSGRQLIFDSYDRLLLSWGVDAQEMNLDTTFGQTHVIAVGDRQHPPLLLFHGTADNSAMMWIYNIRALAEKFYVIAVDAIGGSGKSEPNAAYFKSFNQTAWIDEIYNALNLRTSNLCGVSYGAYLSYGYTLSRPEKVEKAVCLAGRIPSTPFEVFTKMMAAFMPEALFPSEKNCKKLLRKLSGSNYSVFEENQELMSHWFYLLKYFNNQSMMRHRIEIHTDTEITRLRDKVVFLIGEHDRLSNYPKAIKRLEDNRIQYKIIQDAGHALNHEKSERINKEIIDFLTRAN